MFYLLIITEMLSDHGQEESTHYEDDCIKISDDGVATSLLKQHCDTTVLIKSVRPFLANESLVLQILVGLVNEHCFKSGFPKFNFIVVPLGEMKIYSAFFIHRSAGIWWSRAKNKQSSRTAVVVLVTT